ncbi:MAG: putative lipase [Candidatus Eremiobacteraeota bacterium]|nr:putative lipase [Candidatus Eremiobacteraeota bacterium]
MIAKGSRTILMVPGYNEPPAHFEILKDGKDGIVGLEELGYRCPTFPQQEDELRERIDRFADHLLQLRSDGHSFPIVTLGYSLGGLIVRGFLRAYPDRAHEISHTIMVATPNWGLVTLAMPFLTRFLRMPYRSMQEMNLNSDFMQWLNKSTGRWVHTHDKRNKIWVLDHEPWVGHDNVLIIQGLIPSRGGDNDGLVWADSSTLGSRIPAHYIIGPHCNHMNIIGHYDPLMMLSKGFLSNDAVWPLALDAILRFLQPTGPAAALETT